MALVVGTNSYQDVSGADAYFADNLRNTRWTALSTTTKEQALITASGQISLFVKDDCKLPLITISVELENAASELALDMALNPSLVTQGIASTNTQKIKTGSVEVTFFRPIDGARFPTTVMTLLAEGDCLDTSDSGVFVLAFGSDAESVFKDPDPFEVTEGFP